MAKIPISWHISLDKGKIERRKRLTFPVYLLWMRLFNRRIRRNILHVGEGTRHTEFNSQWVHHEVSRYGNSLNTLEFSLLWPHNQPRFQPLSLGLRDKEAQTTNRTVNSMNNDSKNKSRRQKRSLPRILILDCVIQISYGSRRWG